MKAFVGTSGWSYDWNPDGLPWYAEESGMNAVELNASFYRFPYPQFVRHWRERGRDLRWSVKIHRSITHIHKFNERAWEIWGRFRERFHLLDEITDFYLFQAPPRFRDTERIEHFIQEVNLKGRIALELREPVVLADEETCAHLQKKILLVSVDSPDFQNRIFHGPVIYLRLHGRKDWYQHAYTNEELKEILSVVRENEPERFYAFFNNDPHMLENARRMRTLIDTQR